MIPPNRRLLAALLAVVIAVVIGLVAWINQPDWPSSRGSGRFSCGQNLRVLYSAMHIYCSRFGHNVEYPPHRGERFWMCLAGKCGDKKQHPESYFEQAPLAGFPEYLQCLDRLDSEPTEACSYRGPMETTLGVMRDALKSGKPPDLFPRLPLACEKPGHRAKPGGYVLFTNGNVQFLSGAEYEDALRKTE